MIRKRLPRTWCGVGAGFSERSCPNKIERNDDSKNLTDVTWVRRERPMKISVVTASFNSEATIGFTIESFLGQSHAEKEMLVIDGASGDGTLKIVESFASDAIRVFSEPDKGVYDAMNKGFHLFQGDAIGFLNSDDTFHDSRALGEIAAALQDSDIVYGDLDMVTDHRSKRVVRSWRGGSFKHNSFQLGWVPPHPT